MNPLRACAAAPASALFLSLCVSPAPPAAAQASVIFVHPDGASAATWAAARALHAGPDGELYWDQLPHVAVYKGHLNNSLTSSSNGGATAHASGVTPGYDAFGRSEGGVAEADLLDEKGGSLLLGRAAIAAGIPTGLVQSGIAPEPGTAVFLVDHESRKDHEAIALKLIESGARVLMSGGEKHFLPQGTRGVHGMGVRTDGRDLVEEARERGYTVVRTRVELLLLPADTQKVLGLFAEGATFNDATEEVNRERGLEPFDPAAPTLAEMTAAAIRVLAQDGDAFFLVVEEEGTDNLGNKNNAAGTLEAARRADAALGVAKTWVDQNPDTLLITAADSDGGGLRMSGFPESAIRGQAPAVTPETARNGAPMDGIDGTSTAPFRAKPNAAGKRLPFAIVWSHLNDVSGGVVVRAIGKNADQVRGTMSNVEVSDLMRATLFGE